MMLQKGLRIYSSDEFCPTRTISKIFAGIDLNVYILYKKRLKKQETFNRKNTNSKYKHAFLHGCRICAVNLTESSNPRERTFFRPGEFLVEKKEREGKKRRAKDKNEEATRVQKPRSKLRSTNEAI